MPRGRLQGAHRRAACSACHRDVHGGYAGVQCASCHDVEGWKSRFDADAHRRTNFPLQGRHALLPCEQCHGDRRDRSFARPTVACWECHQADLQTAVGQGGRSPAASRATRSSPAWAATASGAGAPGTFGGHGACFPIDSGNHAGITCTKCHVTLPVPLADRLLLQRAVPRLHPVPLLRLGAAESQRRAGLLLREPRPALLRMSSAGYGPKAAAAHPRAEEGEAMSALPRPRPPPGGLAPPPAAARAPGSRAARQARLRPWPAGSRGR